jgi:hypothetical protein
MIFAIMVGLRFPMVRWFLGVGSTPPGTDQVIADGDLVIADGDTVVAS